MPIYDIQCQKCGRTSEVIVPHSGASLVCPECGHSDVVKLMSPSSSLTGRAGQAFPGPGDTSCCGSSPGQAGCAGPGSCCGKAGLV
jgi:putative FmdB family regulatory protein